MPTFEEIDKLHTRARETGMLVFRYVQGFNDADEVGDGVCFALSYKWITAQLKGKLPLEGIVDRRSLARGIPLSTPFASRFPNLVQLPINADIKMIQEKCKSFEGIRNHAALDDFKCTTEALGQQLTDATGAQTVLDGIWACYKHLQRGFGMVGMRSVDKKSGHAIAFQIFQDAMFRLFDPNLGEFRFKTDESFKKNFKGIFNFMEYNKKYQGEWCIMGFKFAILGGL